MHVRPMAGTDDRDRISITVRPAMGRYIKQLLRLDLYGKDETAIATRFVEEGIRRALECGIIHPESD